MFTLTISIPKSSRHSNPNEVSWELVHSYFSDLFSEEFLCVVKPFNGDHTLAKLYFKNKVTFSRRSDEFLINNTVPAKIVERKEEPDLPPTTSGQVKLPRKFTEQELAPIKVDLDEQYQVEMQLTEPKLAMLHACHPEVLSCAQSALRKWASEQPTSTASRASSVISSTSRSRRPLFPDIVSQDVPAVEGACAVVPVDTQYLRDLGPYDFELALNDRCSLRVEPRDITTLQCDALIVTTSCALSLNFGLARVVAAKLPARHILFLALPNDSRLEQTIDHNAFKEVMKDVINALLSTLSQLSTELGIQVVGMTPIGASLPYWTDRSEDFAHVLAEAFHSAGSRNRTGDLRRLCICDLGLETLATLGRVLEARFGAQLPRVLPPPSRNLLVEGREFASRPNNTAAAAAAVSLHADDEEFGADCELCCEPLSMAKPAAAFHCNRGQLCVTCVRKLNDPTAPGNGLCPLCMHRAAVGSQPANGTMTVTKEALSLPGHPGYATQVVTYTFGPGVQGRETNPGLPYRGVSRVTYFPDSPEGRAIVERLQAAFRGRAVFTIGTSATTGMDNTITWATVHHKTRIDGGPEGTRIEKTHRSCVAISNFVFNEIESDNIKLDKEVSREQANEAADNGRG
uniref:E3 ubiquitin-protein ligase n=1 Tax=Macrostomum lignano TaxID=282301 RepID=A0A1I8GDN0_9PLAT